MACRRLDDQLQVTSLRAQHADRRPVVVRCALCLGRVMREERSVRDDRDVDTGMLLPLAGYSGGSVGGSIG